MVAVIKIEPATQTHHHSAKLESLLLDKNYKKNEPIKNIINTEIKTNSRIEAECKMERIFMSLF